MAPGWGGSDTRTRARTLRIGIDILGAESGAVRNKQRVWVLELVQEYENGLPRRNFAKLPFSWGDCGMTYKEIRCLPNGHRNFTKRFEMCQRSRDINHTLSS